MSELCFEKTFETLTGHQPFAWQRRLYDRFRSGDLPKVIDLPTGMGKTAVIAIWLLARKSQLTGGNAERLSTRLVYVVDRRTVVDQATATAERIRENSEKVGIDPPAVSTLRGQFADNREWTRDPSKPSIVIGTVDMIGSRLLFSGYRSSYKQRPLDAGLLGQDSLLILDEAHLSEPFARLTHEIGRDGAFQQGQGQGKPMCCMSMSATSSEAATDGFRLEASDLKDSPDGNVVLRRYKAEKHLSIHRDIADGKKEIVKKVAELAVGNSRVVVFVRSPDDAQKIYDAVRKIASKNGSAPIGVELLTGTMRGLERDEFLGKPTIKRFLDAESGTADGPVVLVSTSAGEVGFDLNADHLICDAAPLDSIIQRFGRVNRRGEGVAEVHLFVAKPKGMQSDAARKNSQEHTFDTAAVMTVEILGRLPLIGDAIHDASPKALGALDKSPEALTPKPATVELTDILLDAWSMTTIVEPMPGRPPVANWLRGVADELPETTISWRAELDIAGFADLDIGDIEEWFDAHRVLPHETLTLPSHKAGQLLLDRWEGLGEDRKAKLKNAICVIDQGGLRVVRLANLMDDLKKTRQSLAANADIILPASFGGIQRGVGVLDPSTDGNSATTDVADEKDYAGMQRYRVVRINGDEHPILGELPAAGQRQNLSEFTLDMPADGDGTRQLVSLMPKQQRPELGTQTQRLTNHVAAVVRHAERLANQLDLQGTPRDALMLAARWHDQGKARELWQRAVGGSTDNLLAKSGGKMQPIPGGYRHEFGSLQGMMEVEWEAARPEVLDLAAHMVAAHHGRSRPHFRKGGFDPNARAKSPSLAAEAMRRFAKLQKEYGWWYLAWLENLLRCADALASAENITEGGQ